jgi:NAD(P)-dependent dehydrogenase (short-subunit alcohol dehydrogenase family)
MTAGDADLRGRVAIVTGANGGIGRETARALARMGATVGMVARDPARGREALDDIRRSHPTADVHLLLADLSRQADVRRLADDALRRFGSIHALVNVAAAYSRKRRVTEDGIEMQLAVNHLAPYLLTRLLLERMTASAPARVVTLSSAAHGGGRIHWDDLQAERRYRGFGRYGDTKLMNVLFTRELGRRTAGTGVTANAAHPGLVGTELLFGGLPLLRLFRRWMKTPAQGAETPVYLASSPAVADVTGGYFIDRASTDPAPQAMDDAAAARLWSESARLVGLEND